MADPFDHLLLLYFGTDFLKSKKKLRLPPQGGASRQGKNRTCLRTPISEEGGYSPSPQSSPVKRKGRQSPSPLPSPLKGEGTYKVIFSVGRGRSRKMSYLGEED
jgi:hypothetical protein